MTPNPTEIIDYLHSLSLQERINFVDALSLKEKRFISDLLYSEPNLLLFDKQIIPDDCLSRYIILRCGRRFGKGISGSAFIARKILQGAKVIGLAGAKHEDVWKIMVPYLLNWFPPAIRKKTIARRHDHLILMPNEVEIHTFTSDAENRGSSLEYLWADEIGSWCDNIDAKVKERFEILDTAVSAGPNPQTIATSTPKPFQLYRQWHQKILDKHPEYYLITGNMDDNPYLSEKYKQSEREKYGNSRWGRQEYYGELLLDTPGALWSHDDIKILDQPYELPSISKYGELTRIVLAVDHAVSTNSSSDETGIIIVAKRKDKTAVVLEDLSGKYTPLEWAKLVNKKYKQYHINQVIIERNMGGDLVAQNLRTVNPYMAIKEVIASKGKRLRAEPIASLYQQGHIFHNTNFTQLQEEMTTYTGNKNDKSPNRLDSLTYCLHELYIADYGSSSIGGISNLPSYR